MVEVLFKTAGTAPSVTVDGFFNIFSEARLRVNDVLGSRNLIQCPSSQLIQFNRDQGNAIDRHSLAGNRPQVADKKYRMFVPIWIRHPAVAEPVGNLLALPLDQLNEDPILELDVASNLECAGTNPSVSLEYIRAVLIYREIDPAVKYMPTELVTSKWTLPGSGRQSFELSNGGFLSSVTLDTYTTFPGTRAVLWSSFDHEIQIDSGSTALRRYYPDILDSMNDTVIGNQMFGGTWFSASALIDTGGATSGYVVGSGGIGLGHSFVDFLFDDSFGGAVSPGSMLNCNTIPLGGDKIKITGTNFSAAGTIAVTTHKFLTRSTEELKALIGA